MIGPPRVAVYCGRLYQIGAMPCLLFDHVLALRAELRTFKVAPPCN